MLTIKSPSPFIKNISGSCCPRIGRVYLNNIDDMFDALKLVKKYQYLNTKEMIAKTASVREEKLREIYKYLWRFGINVEVIRDGHGVAFSYNEKLCGPITKADFERILEERLLHYVPFGLVLDLISKLNSANKNINEKILEKTIHQEDSPGNSDNLHPLTRMIKGFGLTDKQYILKNKGIEFLKKMHKIRTRYLSLADDVKTNKDKLAFINYLHNESIIKRNLKIPLKSVKIANSKIFDYLKEFSISHSVNDEMLILKEYIYFDINAIDYIRKQLNKTNCSVQDSTCTGFRPKTKIVSPTSSGIAALGLKNKILFIENQPGDIKTKKIKDSLHITYDQFFKIEPSIPTSGIKSIVLQGSCTYQNTQISGTLNAFIRLGGNLVIVEYKEGRVGQNKNMYSWLPFELQKISWYKEKVFKLPSNIDLKLVSRKISNLALNQESEQIFNYHKGTLLFIGDSNDLSDNHFSNLIPQYFSEFVKEWEYRWIPGLSSSSPIGGLGDIYRERDIYPFLCDIFENYLNLSAKNLGQSGRTDVLITEPFKCCIEVNVLRPDQVAGQEKVTEVNRHRKSEFSRLIKNGHTNYASSDGDNPNILDNAHEEMGACVLGYIFSTDDGIGGEGAITTAKHHRVNLLTYFDIYDLAIMKHKDPNLNIEYFLFNHDNNFVEVSDKIIDYVT